jgi:hypothetical protein
VATSLQNRSFSFSRHLWLMRSRITRSGSGADPSPKPQQTSAAGFGIAGGCAGGISVQVGVEQKMNVAGEVPADHENLHAQAGVPVPHKKST